VRRFSVNKRLTFLSRNVTAVLQSPYLSFAWRTHRTTGEVLKILNRGAAIDDAL